MPRNVYEERNEEARTTLLGGDGNATHHQNYLQ